MEGVQWFLLKSMTISLVFSTLRSVQDLDLYSNSKLHQLMCNVNVLDIALPILYVNKSLLGQVDPYMF